ncbi:histidine phosphatase family protein [Kitasatospora viridis]|uniref:phosphoglycerate mutase (2,3-diphosphoglycerate-dependent) n=1 Tax=Kitasatospora viridis TaxID=281105 RepID=A0A561TVR9_9ACTN|nr:histidine phosphatase family protein [Kitasatospora viridis]TWF91201.1 broad specificity phosphatase PhoE [Kitasatospora viridis]
MPLYFIRHGESQANEQNRFAGQLDSPLTGLGIRQAEQAAGQVAALALDPDEVHVSTLARARRTAEIVIAGQPRRPGRVVVSEALVERDFGVFSGHNKSLVKKGIGFAGYTEAFHSHTGRPPGGESWRAMYDRVAAYYQDVLLPASEAGRTVLVVAHKYIVEMFAMAAAGLPPERYRDLKIPNARPLSEDDLRRAAHAPAAAGLLNDLGEIVEIRLPLLVALAAAAGVGAQLLAGVHVPAWEFSAAMTLLLAVATFFTLLRVDPRTLRDSPGSIRPALPLLLARFGIGLVLLWGGSGLPVELAGLFLLLPPALLVPTLSLLWGGDYFFAVRHTVAASAVMPAALVGALAIASPHGAHPDGGLGTALLSYGAVLLAALFLPGAGAQLLRRRDPIRAGALSTNWNWLGGLALVPLAGLATFALTPADPRDIPHLAWQLLLVMAATGTLLATLRLLTVAFLRWRPPTAGLGRDLIITQSTPNVFLWLAMAAVLAPAAGSHPSVIDLGVALVFFLAVYVDERVFRYGHAKDLSSALRRSEAHPFTGSDEPSAGRPELGLRATGSVTPELGGS